MNSIKNILKSKVPKKSWDNWFSTFELVKFNSDKITFSVDNPFIKDWIQSNFKKEIEFSIFKVTGKNIPFEIVFNNGNKEKNEKNTKSSSSLLEKKPLILSNLNDEYTFDKFIVGPENKAIYEVSREISQNPGKYNPFFIYGNVGLGKTHLLQSIAHETMFNFPEKKVIYLKSEEFMNEMIASIKENKIEKFRERYRKKADILLIDDIQFLIEKKGVQNEFFHTFNDLHDSGKQLVICSDRNPSELKTFHERLISRFQMGLVMEINKPGTLTKYIIAKKIAQNQNFSLNDEYANLLSERVNSNIRKLKGIIIKLSVQCKIFNRNVDGEIIKKVLNEFQVFTETQIQSSVYEKLFTSVEKITGINKTEILGQSRDKKIVFARQMMMYILKNYFGKTVTDISREIGRKHSTVIHSTKKIETKLKSGNTEYNIQYNNIIKSVGV
ncbi:MAG: chromosomal replication initiator protein [Kosmotogales bacterium]|nr:chromosomal replication initiator protein [Kosmotogales bacterium]